VARGRFRAGVQSGRRGAASEHLVATENEEASHRVGLLTEVPDLLREFGTDSAEVAASAGLDANGLDALENRIPFVAIGQILRHCAAKTGCQHFALMLGQRTRLSHLGYQGSWPATRRHWARRSEPLPFTNILTVKAWPRFYWRKTALQP